MKNTRDLTLSGLFLALGLVLPFVTMNIPSFGSMILPMHLPVLLCGFVCGWPWGLAVGLIAPLLRSALVGMPPLMPTAFAMAFELAAYGALTGILYRRLPKTVPCLYAALIGAMLGGRIVWGLAMAALAGANFGLAAFWAGAITNALPGILLQLILIPALILALRRAKLMPGSASA